MHPRLLPELLRLMGDASLARKWPPRTGYDEDALIDRRLLKVPFAKLKGFVAEKVMVVETSVSRQDEVLSHFSTKFAMLAIAEEYNVSVDSLLDEVGPRQEPKVYCEAAASEAAAVLGFDEAAATRLLQTLSGPVGWSPHLGKEVLLDSVASGAIAPLKGSWLVALEARGGKLMRRQDLPAEAFFSAAELRVLVEALGDDYGLLFVTLSYRWLSKEHPDPNAFHLAIVAAVARLYMKGEYAGRRRSPLAAAFQANGLGAPDFALFWDFASLYQMPRDAIAERLFLPGLFASNVWYGHQLSVCWMQTELPQGFAMQMNGAGRAQSYDESGWCFAESAISAGLKWARGGSTSPSGLRWRWDSWRTVASGTPTSRSRPCARRRAHRLSSRTR